MKTQINLRKQVVLVILLISCSEESPKCCTCENFSDGYVIGFDPCTGVLDPNGGQVGFIIKMPKDTVVTYNFPKGIYQFPTEYFINYRYNIFFPDSASKDYAIKIKYRLASQKEKVFPLCRADIITGAFNPDNQIITLSITK
ncbi:MAG: hypothetical protein ACKO1F_03810 [Flammeovirgaceae bacterium]